ncbi:MAG: hypothetical protein L0221_17230, partial [Chloroflexi bacterium]|nr:hypothetical protein [Chloroflexota bacterium]
LGDIAGNLGYQNYGAERANMLNVLNAAPAYAQQDYADIAQLDAVGRAREAMAQALLDDQVARWPNTHGDFAWAWRSMPISPRPFPWTCGTSAWTPWRPSNACSGRLPEPR